MSFCGSRPLSSRGYRKRKICHGNCRSRGRILARRMLVVTPIGAGKEIVVGCSGSPRYCQAESTARRNRSRSRLGLARARCRRLPSPAHFRNCLPAEDLMKTVMNGIKTLALVMLLGGNALAQETRPPDGAAAPKPGEPAAQTPPGENVPPAVSDQPAPAPPPPAESVAPLPPTS